MTVVGPSGNQPKEVGLLDQFNLGDIRRWSKLRDDLRRMHWDFQSDLAFQRSKITGKLSKSLQAAAVRGYSFEGWQRVVTYQYATAPLSVSGSLVDPGGRFNIGDIDQSHYTPFPGIYVAKDRMTSLQEALCQSIPESDLDKALDFALTDNRSIAIVSLRGHLDTLIDLNKPDKMREFVDLIKDFKMPKVAFKTSAKYRIKLDIVNSVDNLLKTLLAQHWRSLPMQFDLPSSSQIFGQIVKDAGIEGILYPSKYSGEECIVIFPQNFRNTESFVELVDKPPRGTKFARLDSNNWHEVECAKVPDVDERVLKRVAHTGRLGGIIKNVTDRLMRMLKYGGN